MLNKVKSEQSNDEIIQKQLAGGNSNQFQVGTVNLYQGISEERARKIFLEMIPHALSEYSEAAYTVANERIEQLENAVMPRMIEIDGALSAFADPAFQLLLKKAQQSAVATEREDDYALLSELIVCHVQKGDNRRNRTGIKKAVEIVSDIDSDALCALTIAHAVETYRPVSGKMYEGLQVLNNLFEKLLYMEPASGGDWLDHLDILGAIRLSKFSTLKKFKDYYAENLDGYVCVGIKKESEEYNNCIEILQSEKITLSILVPNDLIEGYVKLPVINKAAINKMMMVNNNCIRKISDSEITALTKVWDLYSKDTSVLEEVKNEFVKVWDSYSALMKVRNWWEALPVAFDITKVGTVLAHTNAKRCDKGVPDLI